MKMVKQRLESLITLHPRLKVWTHSISPFVLDQHIREIYTDRGKIGNSNEGHVPPVSKSSSDVEGIVSPTNSDGLSIKDQKIRMVAKEIDEMGMGRYQWYIWGLCGLGYFLDLLWAQAFGLIAPVMQREMGIDGMCYLSLGSIFKDGELNRGFVLTILEIRVVTLIWLRDELYDQRWC